MNFYFTFGQVHVHPETGEEMKDYYVKIIANNSNIARRKMIEHYGDKWAFMYTDKTFHPEYCPRGCYEVIGDIKPDIIKGKEE